MKRSMKYSIALCALLPVVTMGADTWWSPRTVGNWEDASKWDAGVPTASHRAIINQGADQVTVNTTNAVANEIILRGGLAVASAGKLDTGALNAATGEDAVTVVVDGQLNHGGSSWCQFGGAAGATLTVNSEASLISSGSEFIIGQGGNANLVVDGTFNRAGWMHFGIGTTCGITVNSGAQLHIDVLNTQAGSTVDITINGGVSSINVLKWPNAGTQTLNMNGGQLTIIGLEESAGSTFYINDGELIFSGAALATVEAIVSGPNWIFAENPSVVDNGGSISVTSISSLPPTIISLSAVSSSTVKMVVDTIGLKDSYYPMVSSNLVSGSWATVPHSDDELNPFVVTNLSYSSVDATGTNEVIYLQVDHAQKFFKVDGN